MILNCFAFLALLETQQCRDSSVSAAKKNKKRNKNWFKSGLQSVAREKFKGLLDLCIWGLEQNPFCILLSGDINIEKQSLYLDFLSRKLMLSCRPEVQDSQYTICSVLHALVRTGYYWCLFVQRKLLCALRQRSGKNKNKKTLHKQASSSLMIQPRWRQRHVSVPKAIKHSVLIPYASPAGKSDVGF